MYPEEEKPGIVGKLQAFLKQSERVLNVTHKPKRQEYQHIAYSTAIGMIVLGIIAYIIAMAAHFIRGG